MSTLDSLHVGSIIIGLFGGLALFLFGLEQTTDTLKKATGHRMENLLARLTTNRFTAVFAGTFVTAFIQSSSVTTVLVIGFISAGLLSLSQAIGVIMGAEIGTTVAVQIIALKITKYALALIAVGFGLQTLAKRNRRQLYGTLIMGLGLIFLGMQLMSDATGPLRTYQPFIDLMKHMENPLVGVILGALFTGMIQSSSATIGIVIVLASQGFLTLEGSIAIVFGANIGTCVTALLASIGKPREAKQAAVVHILFNVMGVVIWFHFIDQLALVARIISPTARELTGAARLAAETPRQIANAHTIFNVANTLTFIGVVGPLAGFVQHLIPARPALVDGQVQLQPQYLEKIFLDTPELALDRVRLELSRLGEYALQMVRTALPIVFAGEQDDLDTLAQMDDNVDRLHVAIVDYLSRLAQEDLLESQSERLYNYMVIANSIENIGDMIQTNLVESGNARLRHGITINPLTQEVLTNLHAKVCWAIEQSLEALATSDKKTVKAVRAAKPEINRLAGEAENHLAQRLTTEEPDRLAAFRIESELIEYLKRIYYFARHIRFDRKPETIPFGGHTQAAAGS